MRPRDGAWQGLAGPGNTACVCMAAQALPGSHPSCHHHGPSSNLADRIDRPPSTPCRDCPWPLLVPNPANCGCRRRSSPRSRSTTTRPGHHHASSPNGPASPMQRPGNSYTSSWAIMMRYHDEIGTPLTAKSMLLWVILVIISPSASFA